MNTQIQECYESDTIDCIIPQESTSYSKLPTHIIKWQPFLNPIQNLVITYITTRIHKKLGYAFPSTKRGADDCNISENTFIKTVKFLEQLGLIHIDRSNRSNRYYLKASNEPTEENISKFLPECIKKFKRRNHTIKKTTLINFKKQNTSDYTKPDDQNEAFYKNQKESSPHRVMCKQNLQIQNLSKQQHQTNSHTCSNKLEQNLNKKITAVDVDVDFSKVNTLKNYGISSTKAINLSQEIDQRINVNNFIQYVLHDVGRNLDIKNKAGFIIYAIQYLQEDYLEKLKSTHKKKETNDNFKIKFKQIKELLEDHAIKKWHSMTEIDKKSVREEILKGDGLISGYDYAPETLELFYIDYVKRNFLELTEEEYRIINKTEEELTVSDKNKLTDLLMNFKE